MISPDNDIADQLLNFQPVAGGDPVLFAACSNYCVHFLSFRAARPMLSALWGVAGQGIGCAFAQTGLKSGQL